MRFGRELRQAVAGILIIDAVLVMSGLFAGVADRRMLCSLLVGSIAAWGNFMLLCLLAGRAVTRRPGGAGALMTLGYFGRYLLWGAVIWLGLALPFFRAWAVILPLFGPKLAMLWSGIFDRRGVQAAEPVDNHQIASGDEPTEAIAADGQQAEGVKGQSPDRPAAIHAGTSTYQSADRSTEQIATSDGADFRGQDTDTALVESRRKNAEPKGGRS